MLTLVLGLILGYQPFVPKNIQYVLPVKQVTYTVINQKTNKYNEFTTWFILENGERIPAYIHGIQHETNRNAEIKETYGLSFSESAKKSTGIVFYAGTKFDKETSVKEFIVEGPDDYKISVDLPVFFNKPHDKLLGLHLCFGL